MSPEEIDVKLKQVVAKTFRIAADDLNEATAADDVDGWDSLAHATLLIRLEKTFNVEIGREGSQAQNLGDLARLIAKRIAQS